MIRGILYNFISKGLFILGAFTIHAVVGRKLGPEQYGTFGVVLSILTIAYIFLGNGAKQTVSKNVASQPECGKTIFYKGIYIQSIISILLIVIISGGAGYFSEVFNDQGLLIPLQLSSVVIFVQGLFFVCTGTLNGLKLFFYENLLLSIYSVLRPIAAIGLVFIGWGVSGVVIGFFIASFCATITGFIIISKSRGESCDIKKKDLIQPVLLNIIIFSAITSIMNIDVLFVKKLLSQSDSAGFYTASSAFAKPVYWLLVSFGAVALPLVSSSFKIKDLKQCKKYLTQLVRYSVIMFLPVTIIVSATSQDLMIFFYTSVYAAAGKPLMILSFGIFFIGIFNVFAHVMIAVGKEKLTAVLSVFIIIIDMLLNLILIPKYDMTGAAIATTLSSFLLLFFSGWSAIKLIGIDIKLMTVIRISVLSTLLYYVAGSGYFNIVPLPLAYSILYVGFGLGLIITREINNDDIFVLKGLLMKNNKGTV